MADRRTGSRGWRSRLADLAAVRETPVRVAGSFGAAAGCGTAPFFVGIVIMPFLIRKLGLNKLIAVGATALLLANPLMMFVMIPQTWLGLVLLGLPAPDWPAEMSLAGMQTMVTGSGTLVLAYAVGGYVFAASFGAAVFFAAWGLLSWYGQRRA